MRAASEIIQSTFDRMPHDSELKDLYELAVKDAIIEAIKECAEVAKIKLQSCGDPMTCGCQGSCEHPVPSINKQSILSLINEVK